MEVVHYENADIKPANLLLKSNPRDYRGFTVKLADFGFVLHLTEVSPKRSNVACRSSVQQSDRLAPGPARELHDPKARNST